MRTFLTTLVDMMRRAFVRLLGITPRRYRELAEHSNERRFTLGFFRLVPAFVRRAGLARRAASLSGSSYASRSQSVIGGFHFVAMRDVDDVHDLRRATCARRGAPAARASARPRNTHTSRKLRLRAHEEIAGLAREHDRVCDA